MVRELLEDVCTHTGIVSQVEMEEYALFALYEADTAGITSWLPITVTISLTAVTSATTSLPVVDLAGVVWRGHF